MNNSHIANATLSDATTCDEDYRSVPRTAKTGDAKPNLSAFFPTKTTTKQYISVSKCI